LLAFQPAVLAEFRVWLVRVGFYVLFVVLVGAWLQLWHLLQNENMQQSKVRLSQFWRRQQTQQEQTFLTISGSSSWACVSCFHPSQRNGSNGSDRTPKVCWSDSVTCSFPQEDD